MIDLHTHPDNWGILPYVELFGIHIPMYSVMLLIGLTAGGFLFFFISRKEKKNYDNTVYIFSAAFVFGVIGAKLPILIYTLPEIIKDPTNVMLYLSGRTIIGGLIGGTIGVVYVKKKMNINERRGNYITPAVALAIAIGRIGCFLRGCCYGVATNINYGVDFGDGILRHPTQLYEVFFHMTFFIVTIRLYNKVKTPGVLFKVYLMSYFVFRFITEFIRVEQKYLFNLTAFQYASFVGIGLLLLKELYYKKQINESVKVV